MKAFIAALAAVLFASSAHALTVQDLESPRAGAQLSAAEITAGFPAAILASLEAPGNAARLIAGATPYMLYSLNYEYAAAGGSATALYEALYAAGGGGAGGDDLIGAYESKIASAEVSGASVKLAARMKAWPSPNIYMTLSQIFWEFASSPEANLTFGQAIAYTTIYAGYNLLAAFSGGYAAGTEFNNLMQEYNPDFDYEVASTFLATLNTMADNYDFSNVAAATAAATFDFLNTLNDPYLFAPVPE
jgi:hypothetical protein